MNDADRQPLLFELGPQVPRARFIKRLQSYPVWTKNKAACIGRYTNYFTYITKHGTYLDACAGPQYERHLDLWSARKVLENKPQWMRNFYLFEKVPSQVAHLENLVAQAHRPKNHTIRVVPGDCNERIPELLNSRCIGDREATFCLLDQRTFECHWKTVQALARYKSAGQHKIELFYFLPNSWLPRALAGIRYAEQVVAWWGSEDWRALAQLSAQERVQLFVERFENELGYAHVHAWPIMNRPGGRKIMYYMIHATDHAEAPQLMSRAYRKVLEPEESAEQLELLFAKNR